MTFDEAYEDEFVQAIIGRLSEKFVSFLDPDDIESYSLEILWECTKRHDPEKSKFHTFFYNHLRYKLLTLWKRKQKEKYRKEKYRDVGGFNKIAPEEMGAFWLDYQIPKRQKMVLDYRLNYGMSFKEIAQKFKKSQQWARSTFYKSLDQIYEIEVNT